MKRLIAPFVACWLFLQGGVIAQERPVAVSTLTTTNTGSSSVCVGCAVGTTTPAGTLLTSTVQANSTVTSGSSAAAGGLISNGPVATARGASFQTAGVNRWSWYANSTAEAGANAGSDFRLDSYTDAGALIGSAMSVTRSTLAASFGGAVTTTGVTRLGSGATSGGWGVNAAGDHTFGASSHIADSSGTPTIQSGFFVSGVTPATIAGTDYGFIVTYGSGAGNVGGVVQFGHTFNSAPVCVSIQDGVTITSSDTTTTTITLVVAANTYTGKVVKVLCRGY